MYFDDLSEITGIAGRTGCAIFVVPNKEKVEIKNAFILEEINEPARLPEAYFA